MERFFQARSVAVVGVSNTPGNMGRAMMHNLMEFRYHGIIYAVGPKGGAFFGHKIYTDVRQIPEPVDLAAVLVPASAVPDVLRGCGEKGIARVVLQSAGFRELGDHRKGLEREVQDILKRYGMRMIGPNCIGIINRKTGMAVPFMPFKAEAPLGRVAVVSQSGGVGAMMINSLATENLGFSKFASIGNKLDVNEIDLLEYLIRDDETDRIFCYLEGISDGRRLMETAFPSSKPIIAHKSNTGTSGSIIAGSHSASLSTNDLVVDAAFRQCGIIRAREQREALDYLKAFALPPVKGNRLAVISRSGGHAVMAADAGEELGFELPPFPPELIRLAQEQSRANVIQLHNPMDLGDLYNLPLYRTLAEKTLERDDIHAVVLIHNYQGVFDAAESRSLISSLGEVMSRLGKPIALCVFTTQAELDYNRKATQFPIFTDPREALRALAWNRDRYNNSYLARRRPLPFASERPAGMDRDRIRYELSELSSGPIPPHKLAAILSACGISLASWERVETEQGAVLAAKRLGFPVALKTAQPEVIHKSDAGGVILGLADESAVRTAYGNLLELGPYALVQRMAGSGLEWLIGGLRDRQFGPVVVAGLGGVYVEVFKETNLRIGPIGHEEAERLVEDCRGAALLGGLRGQPPLDRSALQDVIVRISWLLADFPEIRELDLNPVRVFPQGCLALDWRATKGADS